MRTKMKESLFPNRLRRFLLPLVAVCVLMLFCTGCFTAETLRHVGNTTVSRTGYEWELSPDKSEVIATGELKTAYNYLPFYGNIALFHSLPAWTTSRTYEKHFPLEPLHENLVRFYLEVKPDTGAKPVNMHVSSMMGKPFFLYNLAEHVDDETIPPADSRSIVNGETLRMRIRPEDISAFSEPYCVLMVQPRDALRNLPTEYLVFPCAQDGNRYTMIACRYFGVNGSELNPFDEEAMHQKTGEQKAGPFGWCFRILALPPAVAVDVLAIPIYIWVPIALYFDLNEHNGL